MSAAPDRILEKMLEEERVQSRLLDAALLARIGGYLRPHRPLAVLAVALAVVEALVMTLPALVIGLAVDRIVGQGRAGHPLDVLALQLAGAVGLAGGYSLLLAGVWVVRWTLAVTTSYIVQRLGQIVVHDLRVDVFRHVTGMDAQYFQVNPIGRLVNRTTFDVQALAELFSDAFAQGLRDAFFVLVLVAVMFSLDPVLAAILAAAFPVLALIGYGYRALARGPLRTNAAVQSRMNAWLAENLAGMRENHLYRAERRRAAEFAALTQAHQASITGVVRAWALLRPAMLMTTGTGTVLVLLAGSARAQAGTITVGLLLTFLQYTTRLWVPVRNLTEKFSVIQSALTSAERIVDVLDARPGIADGPRSNAQLTVVRGHIEFERVSIRYPGKQDHALEDVSFEVPAGTMVALVGDTGAGKSTIARLISRFYEPDSGAVRIDGHDLREYRLRALRSAIAIVPQEVVVFAASVRENVTLGVDLPDEQIRAVLDAVCAAEFVERLPGRLDAVLEEAGRTLSAGERQLLSFARALVINPPILVLDEATANVDTRTEQLIQRALANLTRGRTSVVIAHRLSTIRDADQILVLRQGRIVERGRHADLLAAGGEYARLHRLHHRGQNEPADPVD